jgi:acyl-coenzyme A synthetase/AMP-(fatty) acid ligase/thioesterase domain-containing protein/acyl carrier protein
LSQVLADARPALIIGQEDVLRGIQTVDQPRRIQLTRLPEPAARQGWRPAGLGLDQPACVLFTSGSTGRPKGIVNSERSLLQRVAQSVNAAHINAADRFLTLASPCTIVGVRDILTALLAGASVHLLDPQRVGAREILHVIRKERITVLFAFPALLMSVVAYAGEGAGAALRLVRVGGDTTLWSDIDRLRAWLAPEAAIQSIYAATEAPMMQWFVDDACRTDSDQIPIGFPLPGNRLALIDDFGCNTPAGDIGELVVASPYVTLGLWADGNFTTANIESYGACRLFRTGDLVRQRPDGLLVRIGRKDRQVKIRGIRVDLDGVEAALRKHPLVRDAGALVRTGNAEGEVTLVAYMTTHAAADRQLDVLPDDLHKMMGSLPRAMRPARLYFTETIPRLPSSKLDLRGLRALDERTTQTERARIAAALNAGPAEGDRIARTVAQIWQDVLQAPVRGPSDDFFEAGGDSLKAMTFMMELERALDREISSTLIAEAPKFGPLCDALREYRDGNCGPLVILKEGAGAPPVFFIPGLGGSVSGLFPIARRMTCSGAVIGIQARGLAGGELPHLSVAAMATEYLREIKRHQPAGPYYLCGYSFGGVVAFEMARRLVGSGDQVGLVGLLDTMRSPLRWPLRTWLTIIRRRILQFAVGATLPMNTWPATVRKTAGPVREKLGGYRCTRVLKVAACALIASARYRPGFYPGELTLFSPAVREPGLPSLDAIWSKHARRVFLVETAGTHTTMLSAPNVDFAAASMMQRLREAMRR